jgi:hypothetical protein
MNTSPTELRGKALYIQKFGQKQYDTVMNHLLPPDTNPSTWSSTKKKTEQLKLRFWLVLLKAMVRLSTRKMGKRISHPVGIGARGTLKVSASIHSTDLPLFEENESFDVIVRHSDLHQYDNACNTGRGMSIKILDKEGQSVLDLLMNSGIYTTFWNIPTFFDFVKFRGAGETSGNIGNYVKNNPFVLSDAYNRAETYSNLNYYSKLRYNCMTRKGKKMACQFRCIAKGNTQDPESTNTMTDVNGNWSNRRAKTDTRPYDFLLKEYANRLLQGPVLYTLQVQFKEILPEHHTFSRDLYYYNAVWDEPWMDIGEVSMKALLSGDETRELCYSILNRPSWLTIPESKSIADYCSPGVLREQVYQAAHETRKLVYSKRLKKGTASHFNYGTHTHPAEDGSNIKIKKKKSTLLL